MKQYLLSVCYPADATPPPPDRLEKIMRDVAALRREMQAAGAWVFGGGLHPPNTATVIRHRNGETIVTDGPFIETKEVIGGYWMIEVGSREEAIQWARRCPASDGDVIEVRRVQEMGDFPEDVQKAAGGFSL